MALTNLAGISDRLRLATRGKSLLRIKIHVQNTQSCLRKPDLSISLVFPCVHLTNVLSSKKEFHKCSHRCVIFMTLHLSNPNRQDPKNLKSCVNILTRTFGGNPKSQLINKMHIKSQVFTSFQNVSFILCVYVSQTKDHKREGSPKN